MSNEQTPRSDLTAPPNPGLSKDAWAGITAISLALISAVVTLATHFVPAGRPPAHASTELHSTRVDTAAATATASRCQARGERDPAKTSGTIRYSTAYDPRTPGEPDRRTP